MHRIRQQHLQLGWYPVVRVYRSTPMEVIDAFEQAGRQHGLPTTIRVYQDNQFTSKELDLWPVRMEDRNGEPRTMK
jgi:hypothetical protein